MTSSIPDCAICLSQINATDSSTTACNHVFHTSCLILAALVNPTNPLCPLCRGQLTPRPNSENPSLHCPRQTIQHIINAYEVGKTSSNHFQALRDVISTLVTRQTPSVLLNNFRPFHIDHTSITLSYTNIADIIIDAITLDEETYSRHNIINNPYSYRNLSNTLYNLLLHPSNQLLENLNNTFLNTELGNNDTAITDVNTPTTIYTHPE